MAIINRSSLYVNTQKAKHESYGKRLPNKMIMNAIHDKQSSFMLHQNIVYLSEHILFLSLIESTKKYQKLYKNHYYEELI